MAVIKIRDALLPLSFFQFCSFGCCCLRRFGITEKAREGLVVQGIVYNHKWILPYRNGDLPSKPPLFHWIAAVPGFMFGVNDAIVRLPSVLGATVMTIVTFLVGNAIGGPRVGWLAVGALLGMHEFWDSALATGKRSVYLLPLYPALALLAARWIDATLYPALDKFTQTTLTPPITRGFRRAIFATSVGSAILLSISR